MATPSFNDTGNMTEISDADTAGSGWNITDLDSVIKVEGTNSHYDAIRDDGTLTWTGTTHDMSATDTHLRLWVRHSFYANLDTKANGGLRLNVQDTSNNLNSYYASGSDQHEGAWELLNVDLSAPDIDGSANLALIDTIEFELVHATAARNIDNTWWDISYFGTIVEFYGGSTSDKVTWATLAAGDTGASTAKWYGAIQQIRGGAYYLNSPLAIGDSASTNDCYFDGTNETIVFYAANEKTGWYGLLGTGNSTGTTDIDLSGASILSSSSRFYIDMSGANVTSFKADATSFKNAAASTFKSGQSITGATFDDCGQITPDGADLTGTIVKNYEGTTSTGALIYNVSGDPDGELDDMSFTKGTAATHAIQFGTTAPTTMTLRGIAFSGYNASDAQNDSTLYFADKGSDTTWTVNLVGCTGNISYKKARAGDTINLVINPVTTGITVKDADANNITGARVLVWVTDNANYFYQATVSITGSGTTATVSHTAHGLSTGDYVIIEGVTNDDTYNGQYSVTVTGVNSYTYTTNETINIGTASGTIRSTMALISAVTTATGYVSDYRSWTADQPIAGRIRKSSASPYYVTARFTGTIDKDTGYTNIIQMTLDE